LFPGLKKQARCLRSQGAPRALPGRSQDAPRTRKVMTCPGFAQLLDYLDGRLHRTAVESVSTHLAQECRRCEADVSWYRQVKLVAASDDSVEPPPWVVKRALRLFTAPPVSVSIGARVGAVVASLVFDSFSRPAMAGARSSGVEDRQLLYRAQDYSIDVQVAASDESRAEVNGQILREGELMFESVTGLQLDLIRNDGTVLSTVTNDRGEFTIPAIEFGSYDLRVDAYEASITIVGLPIAE
jgi:hypothetical protein